MHWFFYLSHTFFLQFGPKKIEFISNGKKDSHEKNKVYKYENYPECNIYADKKYEIILSSVLIFWMLYYKTKF